ncbi:hypothetical protein AVEN_20460-1 [Araneus ventricosus]|uniref:Uncharacterized protein n=1 Tax=Araneus ventricosus TaxID=182803 RepID=A0A4Y2P7T9_ARAVE|nr:hypothetical protein AVEN_20460-1 [Araneus ventricosus]
MKTKLELKSEEEKREEGEETHCIICAETFEEDWIQCRICEGWAHENFANLEENNLFYECEENAFIEQVLYGIESGPTELGKIFYNIGEA